MVDQGIVPDYERGTGRNVLIIEKDPLQAYLLQVTLREAGWVVQLADTPAEGLRYCENDLFDAAITNYSYPDGTNGFSLGETLQTQFHLPSIMITAARLIELTRCLHFNPKQKILFKPYELHKAKQLLERMTANSVVSSFY